MNTTKDRKDVIHPIKATGNIENAYKRYIISTFKTDFDCYNEEIKRLVEGGDYQLVKGPYLQISRNFLKGKSVRSLIVEGKLSEEFLKIKPEDFNIDMNLFAHQEKAIENIILKDRNTVVSTGTGSGKTESFLIPIIDHLMNEIESGSISREGVRAMIIYPLNALVNDQIGRLREILKDYPKITYGFFTGDTKKSEKEARKARLNQLSIENGGVDSFDDLPKIPENEILSRERMRDEPPHILITNYPMLERILILPENNVGIFNPYNSDLWKYIVLDEVHTYSGAKGAEVSMLLRRVKETIGTDKLRFILTSATLGTEDENQAVAEFASDLTDSEFESNDIIRARYEIVEKPAEIISYDRAFYAGIIDSGFDEELIGISLNRGKDDSQSLAERILADDMYWNLHESLKDGAKTLDVISNEIKHDAEDIIDFVRVSSYAKDDKGNKPFDAKYHSFMRAMEGVYITLQPDNKVSFIPAEEMGEGNDKFKVFQLSSCYNCGKIFLPGHNKDGYLIQSDLSPDIMENDPNSLYALWTSDHEIDQSNEVNYYNLCSKCGVLNPVCGEMYCNCGQKYHNLVQKVTEDVKKICTCPGCGQINTQIGIARDFYLGSDAASSVIASALYKEVPAEHVRGKIDSKQILMFSDSRADASYAAVNLENTYMNILHHRAMYKVIEENRDILLKEGMPFKYFKQKLTNVFIDIYNIDRIQAEKMAEKAIVRDAACHNSTKSMEYRGYFKFEHKDSEKVKEIGGLTKEESVELINLLVKQVRDKNCVHINDTSMDSKDFEDLSLYGGISKDTKKKSRTFLTKSTKSYLGKIPGLDDIEGFTDFFFNKYLRLIKEDYCVIMDDLIVKVPEDIYQCRHCNKSYPFAVMSICPNCSSSELDKKPTDAFVSKDHYDIVYRESELRPMSVEEHTAQLSRERAAENQYGFKNKLINVLSCSTTFEMGVNLGSLTTVFMRNVPPSPANYVQRAGRAGRGPDTSAFILTFCKNRSHDKYYFNEPERMIEGKISAPSINVDNPKIVMRHIFASALAFHWKNIGKSPKDVEELASKEYLDDLRIYLYSKPQKLKEFLTAFVPEGIQEKDFEDITIDIQEFGWANELISKNAFVNDEDNIGRLDNLVYEFDSDIENLMEANEERIDYFIENTIKTLKGDETIGFLSKGNVIPKYGFPVDIVRLENSRKQNNKGDKDLQRDMKLAINEYAPGCQVIVDKKLVTSRYIKKVPGKEWDRYDYAVCNLCKKVHVKRIGSDYSQISEFEPCCGDDTLSGTERFITPRFGFMYDKSEPADIYKPKRSKGIRVGYRSNIDGNAEKFKKGEVNFSIEHNSYDELVALSNDDYFTCEICGHALSSSEYYGSLNKKTKIHNKANGHHCEGRRSKMQLGYAFRTDVAILQFDKKLGKKFIGDVESEEGDHISIMYALIEGLCKVYNIYRREVAGTLSRNMHGDMNYVLFDNTPGGAGFVKNIDENSIVEIIDSAIKVLSGCECGEDEGLTSCYECLRNYDNQYWHSSMRRGPALRYLMELREEMK